MPIPLFQKLTLEETLIETETQLEVQLCRFNNILCCNESELATLRESALQQAKDYQSLLNVKMKLEFELSTYKQLLEGASMGMAVAGGGILGWC